MSGWWTDPANGPTGLRKHRVTGARNMREHRERKRVQAEVRNARATPERRSRKAAWAALETSDRAGTVAPTPPSRRKRSRQRRRKSDQALAAHERATREWLDQTGPGVDF